ncbi:hypothetical protein ACQ1Y7_14715, partial [Enterococcus faecalis]|uniref:hypothetical protein n=1 Tax=Enterococcus faecalis TaxID=1351 RepID=UPI003D6A136B
KLHELNRRKVVIIIEVTLQMQHHIRLATGVLFYKHNIRFPYLHSYEYQQVICLLQRYNQILFHLIL